MKKILTKIGIIISVSLTVAICLIFIGMAYLFLYPKGELFGIVYASDNSRKVYTVGEYNSSQIEEIDISTTGYDIIIESSKKVTAIMAYVKSNVVGFSHKDKDENRLEYRYDNNEKRLALNMVQASGWISARDSYIKIMIPEDIMQSNIKIGVSTKKKSNIIIDGGGKTTLNEIDIKINRGDFFFDGLTVDNLFIKANKSQITAGKKVTGVIKYVSLNIGKSNVNFFNAGGGVEYHEKTQTYTPIEDVDFKIQDLVIEKTLKRSEIRVFNCGFIYTDTSCVADAGNIWIYHLEKANLVSKDLNIKIYELMYDKNESIFTFNGKGNLEILNNYALINATTNSGKIKIEKAYEVMSLETVTGKINIESASNSLSVISYTGDININFDDNAVSSEIINLRTHSGNVKINNLEKIDVVVDEGGVPNIELYFKKVVNKSVINCGKANLFVVVPDNEPVLLDIECNNAILDSHVGTATHDKAMYNGSFIRRVYKDQSVNYLNIITSGTVEIMSNNIYELKK